MDDRPEDFSTVVGAHWRKATAYLLASREPCLRIRNDEIAKIGRNRNLVALKPDQLGRIKTDGTWILGVILCPKDSIEDLVAWVKANRVEPARIWFFLHTTTDMQVLQPWDDAGNRTDQVDIVEDWEDLHPIFGLMLGDKIYEEHGPKRTPLGWTKGRRKQRKSAP